MDVTALLAALGTSRPGLRQQPGDDLIIGASLADAAEAWPRVAISEIELSASLTERLPEDGELVTELDALHFTDLFLSAAIEAGKEPAVAAFAELAGPVLREAIRTVRGAANISDELNSRVMIRVVGPRENAERSLRPAIHTFRGRSSLRSWLRVVAIRDALKLVNSTSRRAQKDQEMLCTLLTPDVGPDMLYMKELYRDTVRNAFATALRELDNKERTLITQHVLDGLTFDQMAPLYGVGRSTIGRRLAAAREKLATLTRREVSTRLEMSNTDIDSVIRLVESQLDITLGPLRNAQTDE